MSATNLMMANIYCYHRPPVQYLSSKVVAPAQLKNTYPLILNLYLQWSALEASVDDLQLWTHFSFTLSYPPLPPLLRIIILKLLLNLGRRWISLRSLLGRSKRGKRTWQCSQVPGRIRNYPLSKQIHLGNACIVRWQKPHNGGKGLWDQRPFVMRVESATGLVALFRSTDLLQVLLLFRHCTPTLTRGLWRWETRVGCKPSNCCKSYLLTQNYRKRVMVMNSARRQTTTILTNNVSPGTLGNSFG